MADETGISWCDSTFNPWLGCTKVGPGCDACYAEQWGKRFNVEWGPGKVRRRTSASNWRKPFAWNGLGRIDGRRRRVFVVGHIGDWRRAAAVLFERHSLSGHPAPRREAGKGTAHSVAPSIGASGRGFERAGETRGQDPVVAVAFDGNNQSGPIDVATAVNAHGGPHGRLDFESETFIAHALRGEGFDAREDGTGRGCPIVPVAFSSKDHGADASHISPTLRAMGQVAVTTKAAVRRLTPRECERLQGFPDDYTLIPYRNKPAADGPRYKALGNSMAVPVMRWIGERIEMVERLAK